MSKGRAKNRKRNTSEPAHVKMHGVITGYDSFVVLLDSDGKQQMLYKHAISTIVPIAAIDLKGAEESEE